MTPRERFIAALERRPLTGRVPHFELEFFLTMEALGKLHPSQRVFGQWDQMEEKERELHRKDIAETQICGRRSTSTPRFTSHPRPWREEEMFRLIDRIREQSGDKYFLFMHGDATFGIPNGDNMYDFAVRMVDDAED